MRESKFTSIFDDPIRKLEKEFFSTRRVNDSFSWPTRRSTSLILARPVLEDRREYNEVIESRVEDEEILENRERELVLKINCIDFRPEEITVTVEENQLLIEGVQERLTGNNSKTKRQFNRKITLPEDSLTKEMNCVAKPNGLLIISIPRKPAEKVNKNEKIIPIRLEKSMTNLDQNSNLQTSPPKSTINESLSSLSTDQMTQNSKSNQTTPFSRQTSNHSTQTDN